MNRTPQTSKNSPSEKARCVGRLHVDDAAGVVRVQRRDEAARPGRSRSSPGRSPPCRGRTRPGARACAARFPRRRGPEGRGRCSRSRRPVVPRSPRRRPGLDAGERRRVRHGERRQVPRPGGRRPGAVELVEGGEPQQQHDGADEERPAAPGGRRRGAARRRLVVAAFRRPASPDGPLAGGASPTFGVCSRRRPPSHLCRGRGRALDLSLCVVPLSRPYASAAFPVSPLRDGGARARGKENAWHAQTTRRRPSSSTTVGCGGALDRYFHITERGSSGPHRGDRRPRHVPDDGLHPVPEPGHPRCGQGQPGDAAPVRRRC